jgi:translation initiation factor IF-3
VRFALVFISSLEVETIAYMNPRDQYGKLPVKENKDLVNELIRFPEVLVIDQNGNQLGVKPRKEAIALAKEVGLDLLCVAPMGKPPVCKIVNYGKYRFEQQKKAKEAKKNQKVIENKEVRFTPQTDMHDLEVKAKAVIKWFAEGSKVKVTVRFRGRQMSHPEVGEATLRQFLDLIKDYSVVDKQPVMEGRQMFALLSPKK